MTTVAIRLKSGHVIAITSAEIVQAEDVEVGVPTRACPSHITLLRPGEDEPARWRCDDLWCAMLRAVSGQERLDPDPG